MLEVPRGATVAPTRLHRPQRASPSYNALGPVLVPCKADCRREWGNHMYPRIILPFMESAEHSTTESRRASEPGRGRTADEPARLGWKGWMDVVWRTIGKIGTDRVVLVAAGVSFFALFALIPGMSALVSLYGLFFDPADVAAQTELLAAFVPAGGLDIIDEQLTRLTGQDTPQLGWALAISLSVALWSASAGVKALFEAMNVVNGESEKRNFFALNAMALFFTLAGIVGVAVAIGIVVFLPMALRLLGVESGWLIQIAGFALLACLLFGGILVLYRFGPSRRRARWRWAFPGAFLSVTTIMAFSVAFSWYTSNFAAYDRTYGSLGALIALLTWIWLSVMVAIVGAELNAEAEHQTAMDSTDPPDRPMGSRGAHMADTLGKSRIEKSGSTATG